MFYCRKETVKSSRNLSKRWENYQFAFAFIQFLWKLIWQLSLLVKYTLNGENLFILFH